MEAAGQDADIRDELDEFAEHVPPDEEDWCCARRVLSLQQDFVDKKSTLQHSIASKNVATTAFFCQNSIAN